MSRKVTMGVLAHVDAGKTTLTEALLYHTGAIRTLGRVDRGDTHLDTDARERSRGITVFAKPAILRRGDLELTMLDTPGHREFSAEAERVLAVLDCALLIVSAADGVEGETESLWNRLRQRNIPTFVFVNKCDLLRSSEDNLLNELRARLDPRLVRFDRPQEDEAFLDDLTLADPELTEPLLEHGALSGERIAASVATGKVFPCVFGSARHLDGIEALLSCLSAYAQGVEASEEDGKRPFCGRVFKVSHDRNGEKLVFLKVTDGVLRVKDAVEGRGDRERHWEGKIHQIRLYSGAGYDSVSEAVRGTVCAVTGLSAAKIGDRLGEESLGEEPGTEEEAFLAYSVVPEEGISMPRLFQDMARLAEEAPELKVAREQEGQILTVRLRGELQREILQNLIAERFGYNVRFDAGRIVYGETIESVTEGVGHYAAQRHAAEIHLLLEPAERGSGLSLATDLPEGAREELWPQEVLRILSEREPRGVLANAPLQDVRITLAAGKADAGAVERGALRQATDRALRNGLRKAKSVLLEPWLDFTFDLPSHAVGRAMHDVQHGGGSFGEPESFGEQTILRGTAPAVVLLDYTQELASYTSGTGRLTCRLRGYDVCHDAEEVIAKTGYDPDAEEGHSADSVFLRRGVAEVVRWDEVEKQMELPSVLNAGTEGDDMRRRAMEYGRSLAGDEELLAIFEKTYGPLKRRNLPPQRRPDDESSSSERTHRVPLFAPQEILIDGYNLINADEELARLARKDFGAAREQLLDLLCNYRGFTEHRVTVVFDAYRVPYGTGSRETYHGVQIVFTMANETADAYLAKATKRLPKDRSVRVVSSDALVQQISLGHGALRQSSREFWEELRRVEEEIRAVLAGE